MLRQRAGLLGMALLTIILVAFSLSCSPGQPTPAATARPTQALTPFHTEQPSPTLTAITAVVVMPTALPSPTPTPVTYQIIKGDTLLGIALKFGISLEALQAANPEADPRILSVGATLVIPPGESIPAEPPAPTPLPLRLEDPLCYSSAEGGAWCFVPVTNSRNKSIENLSARVSLISMDGELIAQGMAIPPLNILRPEERLPLTVFFAPPVPESLIPRAQLLTALPVPQEKERYLNAAAEVEVIQIAPEAEHAVVKGVISLPRKSEPANLIWLVAVAYGAEGKPVGVNKWEAPANLEPGKSLPFELTVYSLGPPIEGIEVLVEARP